MEEKCAKCQYYQTLYIPPLDAYDEVTKACGGKKNGRICTALTNEPNGWVMWLGRADKDAGNGICELFTLRKEKEK